MKQIIIVVTFIYYTTLLATAFHGSDKLRYQLVKELQPHEILNPHTHCLMPYIVRGAASNCPGMNFTIEHIVNNYDDAIFNRKINNRELAGNPSWEESLEEYFDAHPISYLLSLEEVNEIGYTMLNASSLDNSHSFLLHKEFPCFPTDQIVDSSKVVLLLGNKKWIDMHAHPSRDSYLIEFQGPKLIILAPPPAAHILLDRPQYAKVLNELDCCYDFSFDDFFSARFNIENPDLDNHPESAEITFYKASIKSGDVLFIPRKWLHEVHYVGARECVGIGHFVENCNPCLP